MLLNRLTEHNSFHKYQAGFQDDKSTSSNILVLQALMRTLKKRRRPFYALSLDVKKAFDSVSHDALFIALTGAGVPERIRYILRDMYRHCTTTFWCNGRTDGQRVPVRRGIKQGDPLAIPVQLRVGPAT
ncbi:hypothetical protein MTO96_045794 [Rhipicephalus appendiculatus]